MPPSRQAKLDALQAQADQSVKNMGAVMYLRGQQGASLNGMKATADKLSNAASVFKTMTPATKKLDNELNGMHAQMDSLANAASVFKPMPTRTEPSKTGGSE